APLSGGGGVSRPDADHGTGENGLPDRRATLGDPRRRAERLGPGVPEPGNEAAVALVRVDFVHAVYGSAEANEQEGQNREEHQPDNSGFRDEENHLLALRLRVADPRQRFPDPAERVRELARDDLSWEVGRRDSAAARRRGSRPRAPSSRRTNGASDGSADRRRALRGGLMPCLLRATRRRRGSSRTPSRRPSRALPRDGRHGSAPPPGGG